jgi:hypothetical protein
MDWIYTDNYQVPELQSQRIKLIKANQSRSGVVRNYPQLFAQSALIVVPAV